MNALDWGKQWRGAGIAFVLSVVAFAVIFCFAFKGGDATELPWG